MIGACTGTTVASLAPPDRLCQLRSSKNASHRPGSWEVRSVHLGAHLDQDARIAGWSGSSSNENNTPIISLVVTLPFKSFSATTSCWALGRPTGITILPPALSWLIKGDGIKSGAAVAITLSNGACSGQPK